MSETKKCPFCLEDIHNDAVKCKHCTSFVVKKRPVKEWFRDYNARKIAGVCAGLSNQFGIPSSLLRVLFVIGFFLGGWGLIVYISLWILMPWNPDEKMS
ncbi:MAG: PspC domain-containing protein [Pseudomonadota bacterium]